VTVNLLPKYSIHVEVGHEHENKIRFSQKQTFLETITNYTSEQDLTEHIICD